MKLVSILVSTYNDGRYLKEAIDSALSQTYSNIEVVIVDDASTDNTPEVAGMFADSRVRYIRNPSRIGIGATRNRLLEEARGEYLTYLDSDDIYLKEKVQQEVDFLETNKDYAAVYCNLHYFFDGVPEKFYRHRFTFYSGDIFKPLLENQFITNTTLMFRRNVVDQVGGYDTSLGMVEDWPFFLKMARAGMKFGFLEKPLVHFRLRWNNNTNFKNQLAIQTSAVNAFEQIAKGMNREEFEKYEIHLSLARRYFRLAVIQLTNGLRKDSLGTMKKIQKSFFVKMGEWLVWAVLCATPTFLLKIFIEKFWNWKKRNSFLPVEG